MCVVPWMPAVMIGSIETTFKTRGDCVPWASPLLDKKTTGRIGFPTCQNRFDVTRQTIHSPHCNFFLSTTTRPMEINHSTVLAYQSQFQPPQGNAMLGAYCQCHVMQTRYRLD